ncbi:MAG: tRNA (adenosine(37)-N6)-threonylcarbamoyltransferase complex ATPase subunit type 1 TsaE [Actinomycetota bacterium]
MTSQVDLPVDGADATVALGRRIAAHLQAGDLVVLSGELGAGKTTLTRGIGEGLGVRGSVTSPTFVIARRHPSLGDGPALVHVDAYRVTSAAEIDDVDLLDDDAVTVVEWGAGRVEHLSPDRLEIMLRLGESEELRMVTVRGVGDRWQGCDLSSLVHA